MAEEMIAVVSDQDEVIAVEAYSVVHSKALLHRESYVYIIDSKKRVLLQKRSDNHLWDHSSAGHFSDKETYEQGAIRECKEELGITLEENELEEIAYQRFETEKNKRFETVFMVRKDVPEESIDIDHKEVLEAKWYTMKELRIMLSEKTKLTTRCAFFLQHLILPLLEKEETKKRDT